MKRLPPLILALLLAACSAPDAKPAEQESGRDAMRDDADVPPDDATAASLANVTTVEVSGEPGAYTFAVTLESPDTGCEQYADWWEVFTEEGLLYRRILAHSHVDEQPFTRSGGPIDVAEGEEVWVRAHMNDVGYGGQVARVTLGGGVELVEAPGIRRDLADAEPQPTGCAF